MFLSLLQQHHVYTNNAKLHLLHTQNHVYANLVTLCLSHLGIIMCISKHHGKTTPWFISPWEHYFYFTRRNIVFHSLVTLCIYLTKATSCASLNTKTLCVFKRLWFISPWQHYVYFTRRNHVFPSLVTLCMYLTKATSYVSLNNNCCCF